MLNKNKLEPIHSAIVEQQLFSASMLLAGYFQTNIVAEDYIRQVDALTDAALNALDMTTADESAFRQFCQYFYKQLAFSGHQKDFFASKYSLLSNVMDYRTGIPVSLAIVFMQMAQKLGFDVQGVNFPGHFLLRYQFAKGRYRFIDPLDGKNLSWQDVEALYLNVMGEEEYDEEKEIVPEEALAVASTQDIVVRQLHNLKAAFIQERAYAQALQASELLVELCPDDPYERRDRGFLLHQLDCPQVAIADYQFFIKQCPQDPAAQLLKMQLKHFNQQVPIVLH